MPPVRLGLSPRATTFLQLEANSFGWGMMGWSSLNAPASALFCLEMTTVWFPPWSWVSPWALGLSLGFLRCGDSGRCWEFLGLTNTLNEFS